LSGPFCILLRTLEKQTNGPKESNLET
jgi:hypothetical protein